MKKKIRIAALAVVLVLVAVALCGCVKTEKGEGGIVPDGYKRITASGSSLYFPANYTFSPNTSGGRYYTFSGGNANIIEADDNTKVTSMKKWMYKMALKNEFKNQGISADVSVNTYKYYELSGLIILYTEVTVKFTDRTVYEYQFVYNADKLVTVTLAYENAEASDEVVSNILHSIALD